LKTSQIRRKSLLKKKPLSDLPIGKVNRGNPKIQASEQEPLRRHPLVLKTKTTMIVNPKKERIQTMKKKSLKKKMTIVTSTLMTFSPRMRWSRSWRNRTSS